MDEQFLDLAYPPSPQTSVDMTQVNYSVSNDRVSDVGLETN